MLPVDEFRKPASLDQPIAFCPPEATVGAIEYYKVDERRAYPATLNVEVALENGGKTLCLSTRYSQKMYFAKGTASHWNR